MSPTKGFDIPDVLATHCCLHQWLPLMKAAVSCRKFCYINPLVGDFQEENSLVYYCRFIMKGLVYDTDVKKIVCGLIK